MAKDQSQAGERPDNVVRLERAARRMTAVSGLLRATTSLLFRGAVLVVLAGAGILLLSRAGRGLLPGSSAGSAGPVQPRVATVPRPVDWSRVDADVAQAAGTARKRAEEYAAGRLDAWTKQMLVRVDDDFLPWYFSYWNQQVIGLKSCWQGVKYGLAGYVTDEATPSPSTAMVQEIQTEFANRVLRPESARLRIERIAAGAADLYVADLGTRLGEIQSRYDIPQPQWDRYLEGIGTSVQRVDSGRQVPLSLKALAASTAGGGAMAVRSLSRLVSRAEVRLASQVAEKPMAQLAGKTASKVAARAGGKMLGPVIAVGVIAWDIWDHHQTVAENSPVLRDALAEYLSLQNESLLHDPEGGVLAGVRQIEIGIVRSLSHEDATMASAD